MVVVRQVIGRQTAAANSGMLPWRCVACGVVIMSWLRLPCIMRFLVVLPFCALLSAPVCSRSSPGIVAITGGTLIDGNGGAPIGDAVVVVSGNRITAAGPRASVPVPAGATMIDAHGKFLMPGLVDTNVHLSLYGGIGERYETLAKYHPRQQEIVLEAAQLQLKHGVTTVRDSYGLLMPLVAVRDQIAAAPRIGPRILAAGNIVGWGGPYSISFSLIREQGLTLFQEQVNDEVSQGVGEDLVDMEPEELRTAIRAYLDKGPDFIKFGGTAHFARPSFIGFSPEAQKVHRRGGASARQGRRDACDDRRRSAAVDRGRHRSDPASRSCSARASCRTRSSSAIVDTEDRSARC